MAKRQQHAEEDWDYKLDENDPNYSEESDQFSWTEYQPAIEHHHFVHSTKELREAIKDAVTEYIVSYEEEEFAIRIRELNCPHLHYDLPKILLSRSLDHQQDVTDRAFTLIRHLHRHEIVSKAHIQTSFNALFNRLDDLILDVPSAPERLSQIVNRAVAFDLLDEEVGESLMQAAVLFNDAATAQEAKAAIKKLMGEFFVSHDVDELADQICELEMPEFDHEIVKRAIYMAMDRSNIERELTSRVLAELTGDVLQSHEVEKGIFKLLTLVEDLVPDIPNVIHLLSRFIARAFVDEVIPPIFLSQVNIHRDDLGYAVLRQAMTLLRMRHAARRLEYVWGPGEQPVRLLKSNVKMMVKEFYESHDAEEFCRCVEEMNLPRYQHETVRRLFTIGVDRPDKEIELLRELLVTLCESNLVSSTQLKKGLARIQEDLPDLSIDVPKAPEMLEELTAFCVEQGLCPAVENQNE